MTSHSPYVWHLLPYTNHHILILWHQTCRLSYPSMRKGWRGNLTPQRMMTKKMIRINFLEYQPLSHLTVGFRWGKKEFCLSWHHKGGLRRCPLESQYSFCALQQPKCFKAIPCCRVCTPIPVAGEGGSVFQGNPFWTLLKKKKAKGLLWRTKRRMGCGRARDTVNLQRASPQPTQPSSW